MFFSSPDCTVAALVGIVAAVVSSFYRKRLTRFDWSVSLWNEFWKYVTIKTHGDVNTIANNIFMNGIDEEIRNSNNDCKEFRENEVFDDIYVRIQMNHPSHAVHTYISNIIQQHLRNRLLHITSETLCIHKNIEILYHSLEEYPLRILVPLCGCSYDMYYISHLLRTQFKLHPKLFKIIGIEWSLTAILNFFGNNELVHSHSRYNPRYMYYEDFHSVEIYYNTEQSIYIIHADIFKYIDLCKQLKYIGIASSFCLMEEGSIDIIVDINAMSCCDPSERIPYINALRYWLSDAGVMLLDTYCYDEVLSNYPPYTIHPTYIEDVFKRNKCKLLDMERTTHCTSMIESVRRSWLIRK